LIDDKLHTTPTSATQGGTQQKYTEGLSTAKNPKPFCILVYFMYD